MNRFNADGATFSDAVANRVPCKLRAIQLSEASWAVMSTGCRCMSPRSTRLTWPVSSPGYASRELFELGQRTQRPAERERRYRSYVQANNSFSSCMCTKGGGML